MSEVSIVVENLMKGGMSERKEGYDPFGEERKGRLRNERDLGLGTRGIWEL